MWMCEEGKRFVQSAPKVILRSPAEAAWRTKLWKLARTMFAPKTCKRPVFETGAEPRAVKQSHISALISGHCCVSHRMESAVISSLSWWVVWSLFFWLLVLLYVSYEYYQSQIKTIKRPPSKLLSSFAVLFVPSRFHSFNLLRRIRLERLTVHDCKMLYPNINFVIFRCSKQFTLFSHSVLNSFAVSVVTIKHPCVAGWYEIYPDAAIWSLLTPSLVVSIVTDNNMSDSSLKNCVSIYAKWTSYILL